MAHEGESRSRGQGGFLNANAILSRGVVYRLIFAPGIPPRKEWLTRSEALFAPLEWDWSKLFAEAYIFPRYEDAVEMVSSHEGDGGQTRMVPMVHKEETP